MAKGTSKIKKTAHQIGAALKGEAGILNTLDGEHAEVSSLMDECAGGDISTRQKLYPEIRKKLLVHAKSEELEFYPICREHPDTRELTEESVDDHKEVERLLVQLDNLPIDAPAWDETFAVLRDNVEEHVELEENELFPAVKQAFEASRLRDLDRAYKNRKKSLEQRIEDIEPVPPPSGQRPPVV